MMHETLIVQPTLTADRFTLRPCRKSDTGLIEMYASDKRVARGSRAIPHPLPPGTVDAMIQRAQETDRVEDVWVIDGSEHGHVEAMGLISLIRMERDQSEFHGWIAPAFWNAGYASEALRTIIDANPHGSTRMFAEVFQDSPESARVLTNCGFDYLGDAEAFNLGRNAVVPTWTYTLQLPT